MNLQNTCCGSLGPGCKAQETLTNGMKALTRHRRKRKI